MFQLDERRPRLFWSAFAILVVLTTVVPAFDLGSWQRADGDCLGGVATIWAVLATVYFGVPALRQARADARERNRPMVALELRPGDDPDVPMIVLTLRNYGPVVGRNIRVTFDPEIPDRPKDDQFVVMTRYIKRRYSRTILTLTPGQELAQVYTDVVPTDDGGRLGGGMEMVVTATVVCEGPDGSTWTERFDLDAEAIMTTTYGTPAAHKFAKQSARALREIATATGRMNTTLRQGEARRPYAPTSYPAIYRHPVDAYVSDEGVTPPLLLLHEAWFG